MIRLIAKYLLYFMALLFIQVLVLNNMQISSYLNPYVYILLIIILPFETPGWLLLVSGLFSGLVIDVFPQGWSGEGSTLGIHMAATVFTAYIRPSVLRWINPRDDYEPGTLPRAQDYGFIWYALYVILLVSVHHLTLFFLEEMSFQRFPDVFLRSLFSIVFTVGLILIWEVFSYKKTG